MSAPAPSCPTAMAATMRWMPNSRWMREGRFLAVKLASFGNMGGYLSTVGPN